MRRTYRAIHTLYAAIGATVGAAVFLVLALTTSRGAVAAAVVAAVLALLAWRMRLVGIRVGPNGVTVTTTFLSRRVAWREVDRFAVMPLGRYPYVGFVCLRDGRQFGTFGLSTSSGHSEAKRLQIQRPIDELNQALADWRQTIDEETR